MKLSRIVTGMLAVALLAFMVSDTLGQEGGRRGGGRGQGGFGGGRGGPGGGFGGRGGPGGGGGDMTFQLLRNDEVKEEIEIQPDQEEALAKMAEQARGGGGERPDFRNMSEEERNAAFERMRKEFAERATKMKAQLQEVLFPEQLERLKQINLQVLGVRALTQDEVVKALSLSGDQKDKIAEATDPRSMFGRMREVFSSGDREAIREKMDEIRKEIETEALAVLDSDQKKKFEEMKGKPFDIPESLQGGGRGGFGGGRGGPGGGRGGAGRGGPGGRGAGGGRPQRPQAE